MASKDRSEILLKVIVVGDWRAGKTSIIKRFVGNTFITEPAATIGVDFDWKNLHLEDDLIRVKFMDLSGQERFRDLAKVYYEEAVGALVVHDTTQPGSFEATLKWKNEIDHKVGLLGGASIPCVLLCSKCDVPTEIQWSQAEMNKFCKDNGFLTWFETSAKDGTNIDTACEFLIHKILDLSKATQLGEEVAPLVGHAEEEEEKEGVEEEAPSSELVALEPKEEQKQEPKDEQTQEPNEEPQEQTEEQTKEPMQQQTPTPAKPHVKRLAGEVAALQLQLAEAKRLLEGKDAKPKVAAGLARPTLRDMAQQAVGRAGSFGHNAVFGVANAVQSVVSGVGNAIGASSSPFYQTQGHGHPSFGVLAPAGLLTMLMVMLFLGAVAWPLLGFQAETELRLRALKHDMEILETNQTMWLEHEFDFKGQPQPPNEMHQMVMEKVVSLEEQFQDLIHASKSVEGPACPAPEDGVSATEVTLPNKPLFQRVGSILRGGLVVILQFPVYLSRLFLGFLHAVFSAIVEACKAIGRLAASFVRLLRNTGKAVLSAFNDAVTGYPQVVLLVVGMIIGVVLGRTTNRRAPAIRS